MTDSFQYQLSGRTIKFIYRDGLTRQAWNTTLNAGAGGYEAWNDAHYSQYLVAATEEGASGYYVATRPSGVAVPFSISVRLTVDGTLANDQTIGSGEQDDADPDAPPASVEVLAPTYTLSFISRKNGVLYDVTSVMLASPDSTYGLKRTDTGEILVASGAAFTHVSTGIYQYTFDQPALGLTYDYWRHVVVDGQTFDKNVIESGSSGPASVLFSFDEFVARFGLANIISASNKGGDATAPDTVALQQAFDYSVDSVYNALSPGIYAIPLDWTPNAGKVPPQVKEWAMVLAYENLYNARGWQDANQNPVGDKIKALADAVRREMARNRYGIRNRLPAVVKFSPAATIVDTRPAAAAAGYPVVQAWPYRGRW